MEDGQGLVEEIKAYVQEVFPARLGLDKGRNYEIERIIVADYNLNCVVRNDHEKYLLRVNVEQQSGLQNQIEYEYRALKYLEEYEIVPKAYWLDNSKTKLPFGILVEEYLEGNYLDYDDLSGVMDAARLLRKLHRIPVPHDQFLVTWPDPLEESFKDVVKMLKKYSLRKTRDNKIVELSKGLINRLEKRIGSDANLFRCNSIVHTDVVNDNFIRSTDGLKLIDWEKPRIDDQSYDLCCFLGTPSEVWSSPRSMRDEEKSAFLNEYAKDGCADLKEMEERIRIRQPYVSLHWILWAATRLSDLKEGLIARALMEFHSRNISRYQRVAKAEYIADLWKQAV